MSPNSLLQQQTFMYAWYRKAKTTKNYTGFLVH